MSKGLLSRSTAVSGVGLAIALTLTLFQPTEAADLTKVTIAMSSASMSPSYPYLYVADHLGFWKQEGLDVEILLTQGSAQTVQLLAANQATIGLLNPEPVAIARAVKELPIRSADCIGMIFSWSTAVAPNSSIKT